MPAESQIRAAERTIDQGLYELARDVIRRHLDLEMRETQDFLTRPDGRDQHQTMWHQWGIITHTRVFLQHFERDIPAYLQSWGLWDAVNEQLSRPVDGASRWELLRITILLHDIGKFGARFKGRQRFHFTNHERLSGDIIRHELGLSELGLTPTQVEYVALTAEDHFVLGVVRKRAREVGRYDDAFAEGLEFATLCDEIRAAHPLDYVEIGVLFLGDSLAKADPDSGPVQAVSQYATNVAVARRYLSRVLS